MEELIVIALIWMFAGKKETPANGPGNGLTGNGTKKEGPDDWDYNYEDWKKVAQGFATGIAWRVYENLNVDKDFEIAYKNPEGLHSEGGIATLEDVKARGIELGKAATG